MAVVDVAAAVVAAVDAVAAMVADAVVAVDTDIRAPTELTLAYEGPASAGPLFFQQGKTNKAVHQGHGPTGEAGGTPFGVLPRSR